MTTIQLIPNMVSCINSGPCVVCSTILNGCTTLLNMHLKMLKRGKVWDVNKVRALTHYDFWLVVYYFAFVKR